MQLLNAFAIDLYYLNDFDYIHVNTRMIVCNQRGLDLGSTVLHTTTINKIISATYS